VIDLLGDFASEFWFVWIYFLCTVYIQFRDK